MTKGQKARGDGEGDGHVKMQRCGKWPRQQPLSSGGAQGPLRGAGHRSLLPFTDQPSRPSQRPALIWVCGQRAFFGGRLVTQTSRDSIGVQENLLWVPKFALIEFIRHCQVAESGRPPLAGPRAMSCGLGCSCISIARKGVAGGGALRPLPVPRAPQLRSRYPWLLLLRSACVVVCCPGSRPRELLGF